MNLEELNVKRELRIVFIGTDKFASTILEGIMEKYPVKAVVTQPDKITGRNHTLTASPVKKFAQDKLTVAIQPEKIKEQWQEVISFHPNLIITCSYSQIIPTQLLTYPEYGCINVHPSLLPKLRGGAPIIRAIMEGHSKTGVTIMHMNSKMDEGDIIIQQEVEIDKEDNAETLANKLSIVGKELLLKIIPDLVSKSAPRKKQDENEATYAPIIKSEEEKIEFSKTTRQIYNQIRALSPSPAAYCLLEGKRMKVFDSEVSDFSYPEKMDGQITAIYKNGFGVKVSNGEIIFKVVQLEGKGKMMADSFARGYKNLVGKIME